MSKNELILPISLLLSFQFFLSPCHSRGDLGVQLVSILCLRILLSNPSRSFLACSERSSSCGPVTHTLQPHCDPIVLRPTSDFFSPSPYCISPAKYHILHPNAALFSLSALNLSICHVFTYFQNPQKTATRDRLVLFSPHSTLLLCSEPTTSVWHRSLPAFSHLYF